ncbi:MAG: hypothetical protein LUC91_07285 [Prevotella sp.]|nr:hypothetical protein [Prevotella sp.]
MNSDLRKNGECCENVIIADADYIDRVAFDLIVNFERIIGRRIPPADIARWIDCVALDGGVRVGDNNTHVILIHEKDKMAMDNFLPSNHSKDLDSKAFKDNLGEFIISSLPVEDVICKEDFFIDILSHVCGRKEVKRIMVIGDVESYYDHIRHTLRNVDEEKRITVFAMQPMEGGNFRQEILGYSMMSALGIKSDEIK